MGNLGVRIPGIKAKFELPIYQTQVLSFTAVWKNEAQFSWF